MVLNPSNTTWKIIDPKKITIAIAGLGSRGRTAYGAILLEMKDKAKVVAIADYEKARVEIARKDHNVDLSMCFNSVEEMLSKDKLSDAILICTQDRNFYVNNGLHL